MRYILSENSNKVYPKSVTELLRLQEKNFVQGVCYFINDIPIFILKLADSPGLPGYIVDSRRELS
jgi:hypothetical protein